MAKYNPLLGPGPRSAAADRKAAAAARDAHSARWRDAMHKAADDGYNPRPAAASDHAKVRELTVSLDTQFSSGSGLRAAYDADTVRKSGRVKTEARNLLYALDGGMASGSQIHALVAAVEAYANYITDNKARLVANGAYHDADTLRAAAALLRLHSVSGVVHPRIGNSDDYDDNGRAKNPAAKRVTVLEFAETEFSGTEQYTVYGEATVATINGCKVAYVSRFPHITAGRGNPIPLSSAHRFFAMGADGKPDFRLEVAERYPYQPAGHRGGYLVKVGIENGLPRHMRHLHHPYHTKAEALSALCEIKRELDAHEGSRTGNPAASRFVLLDAGPSEGWHGAHERYTLICTTPQGSGSRTYYNYLGFGPGVSGHGELTASDFRALKAEGYRSLGRRIKVEALPSNHRHLAERFIADC